MNCTIRANPSNSTLEQRIAPPLQKKGPLGGEDQNQDNGHTQAPEPRSQNQQSSNEPVNLELEPRELYSAV